MDRMEGRGGPIPAEYRGRLYCWEGGGYDGCIWEPNQGLVTHDGHWRPLYSSGRDGMDADAWFRGMERGLRESLGYGPGPETEYAMRRVEAMKRVYGPVLPASQARDGRDPGSGQAFLKEMGVEEDRISRYRKGLAALEAERRDRQDRIFMDVVSGAVGRDGFHEIGPIDPERVKETCRAFCEDYASNAGLVARVLDGMSEAGYGAWCTCTDCGEQFQPDSGCFSGCIDPDCYRGNGGVGVVMSRILCDRCQEESRCEACGSLSLPNAHARDGGRARDGMPLAAALLHEWMGICENCADSYGRDLLERWDADARAWVRTGLGRRLDGILGDESETCGYHEMESAPGGKARIDAARDLLSESVREWLLPRMDWSALDRRLAERLSGRLAWRPGDGDGKGRGCPPGPA